MTVELFMRFEYKWWTLVELKKRVVSYGNSRAFNYDWTVRFFQSHSIHE